MKWSDGTTEPTRQDVPTESMTLKAIFAPKAEEQRFTLTYTALEGGYIEGESSQSLLEGETGSEVRAVAEEGYRFVSWSDGSTAAVRTDAASEDLTLTASFEKLPEEVIDPEEQPDPEQEPDGEEELVDEGAV